MEDVTFSMDLIINDGDFTIHSLNIVNYVLLKVITGLTNII